MFAFHRNVACAALVLAALVWSARARAYRPFNTEDAAVSGKGVFQLEFSEDFYLWADGGADQIALLVAPIFGPTDSIELSMETPFVVHHPAQGKAACGFGDVSLVIKKVIVWSDYRKGDALLTLKGIIKLNTGHAAEGLGRGDTEIVPVAVVSHAFGDVSLHAQVGYAGVVQKTVAVLESYVLFGGAIDYGPTRAFHLVAEVTGSQNPDHGRTAQAIVLAGVTWAVTQDVILDATVKRGITSTVPEWGWGVGAAFQF